MPAPAPIESAERIREVIRQVYSDDRPPGLAVSVVSRDGVVFEHAEGYADIESKQPMTLAHGHCIGSVTKTMVAVCVMALVDEGRLSLADSYDLNVPGKDYKDMIAAISWRYPMTTRESNHRDGQQPSIDTGEFLDSHGFFALILMSMFAIAIALAVVGLTTPSWLGFS